MGFRSTTAQQTAVRPITDFTGKSGADIRVATEEIIRARTGDSMIKVGRASNRHSQIVRYQKELGRLRAVRPSLVQTVDGY